jgi:putative transposase
MHLGAPSLFLKLVSRQYPNNLNIIQLNNSETRTAGEMSIPENIQLVFQPAYSSELSPIERL